MRGTLRFLGRHSGRIVTSMVAILCFISLGCSVRSYNSQADVFYKPYKAGNLKKAVAEVSKKAEKRDDSRDGLVWRLEEGTVKLAAGDFEGSLKAFERAEEIVAEYEGRASVNVRSVGNEAASALTNPTAISYKGTTYDKIMLNTYKCLAYIRQGKLEEARVEMRRAYKRQQEAVEKYSKKIEKEQAKAKKEGVTFEDTRRKSKDVQGMMQPYDELDRNHAFAVYVNPMTVYVDGLLHLALASDNSDLERAKKNFERVKGMVSSKSLLDPELKAVENRFAGKNNPKAVYVIIENGVAPKRSEKTLNFPTPHKYVRFVNAAIPLIRLQDRPFQGFQIARTDGQLISKAELLASMDAIIVKEFRNQLPVMITRLIVGGIAKNIAQKQAEDHLGLAGLVGTIIYGTIVNHADMRTWLSLPKEFMFTRFTRPSDGRIQLKSASGAVLTEIAVPDGQLVLVYVKAPGTGAISYQAIKMR